MQNPFKRIGDLLEPLIPYNPEAFERISKILPDLNPEDLAGSFENAKKDQLKELSKICQEFEWFYIRYLIDSEIRLRNFGYKEQP